MKKHVKYSLIASLIMLILVSLSFSVFAVDVEITVQKTTGTTISIPQYTEGATIVITGDALEASDWTVLRGLNSATFHLVIRGNTTSIPANALQNNTRILSMVAENVTTVGVGAFIGTASLQHVSLPALTAIPNASPHTLIGVFTGSQFRSIDIPNVTSIGSHAFRANPNLVSVNAPRATSIGESAFQDTSALRVIELSNTPPTFGANVFFGVTNPLVVGTPNAAGNYNLAAAPWPAGTIGLPTHAVNHVLFAVSGNVSVTPNISYDFTPVSWERLSVNGSWVSLEQTGASLSIPRAQASDAGLYRFNFRIGSFNYSLFYRLGIDPDAPSYLGTPVAGVSLNRVSATVTIGDTETLTATVLPLYAANRSVTWSSSDESVATVSADGAVTAISIGTAVITVTTADGGFEASGTFTVTEPLLLSSITRPVTANTEFNIVCSFNNIVLSDDNTFRIKYDTTQIELINFAAQTPGRHTGVGLVAGTNLESVRKEVYV